MAALVVVALILLPAMGFQKLRKFVYLLPLMSLLQKFTPFSWTSRSCPVPRLTITTRYRQRKHAEKELRAENLRLSSEHDRLFTAETAYEPPPYEEIVSAYDVNRNVDDAVKRPLGTEEESRSYQSQQRARG